MDIFAHSVWAAIAAKTYNKKAGGKSGASSTASIGWSAFWGIFPDLFAFGVPFLVFAFLLISGDIPFAPVWPGSQVVASNAPWISGFISHAYQISHSIVICSAAFLLVWAVRKRAPIAMFGWVLHIAIDIFSHAGTFFPTPFLWPVSDWKFLHGVSWANQWYMIINYAVLLVVFWLVFLKKKPTVG